MKILQAHNFYKNVGGEATVVRNERTLLEKNGIEIIPFYKNNSAINNFSMLDKLQLLQSTSWSKQSFSEVSSILKKAAIDVCHVHNFLPLISPSIFHACAENNVPVVLTLHNYRLICANGLLMRQSEICEECLGKSPLPSVPKKCYRDSALQTYAVANMLHKHNKLSTWQNKVDLYFCLTEFAKSKFVQHGLSENKLIVKPNFSKSETVDNESVVKKDFLLFVGRLEKEKGIDLLLQLAPKLNLPIKVIGSGSFEKQLKNVENLIYLGKKEHEEVLEIMKEAKALLFSSQWYEGMPMTIIEAFSVKTPVIASDLGAMQSMIENRKTGLLFDFKSVNSLLQTIQLLLNNAELLKEVTTNAFSKFQQEYSEEKNLKILKSTYQKLIQTNVN